MTREEFDALVAEVRALGQVTASLVQASQLQLNGQIASEKEHEARFRRLENTVQLLSAGLAASRRS